MGDVVERSIAASPRRSAGLPVRDSAPPSSWSGAAGSVVFLHGRLELCCIEPFAPVQVHGRGPPAALGFIALFLYVSLLLTKIGSRVARETSAV